MSTLIDSYTSGQIIAVHFEEGTFSRLGVNDTSLLLRLANEDVALLLRKAEQERATHLPREPLALLPSSPQLHGTFDPAAFAEGFWQELTFLILQRWHGVVSASTLDETRNYALHTHPNTQSR